MVIVVAGVGQVAEVAQEENAVADAIDDLSVVCVEVFHYVKHAVHPLKK